MNLTMVDNGRETVKRYLSSQQWWTIVAFDEHSATVMSEIEDTFYSGKKNADFELCLIPCEGFILGLGMAHKRRMSRNNLVKLLLKLGADKNALKNIRPEQDVLFPSFRSNHRKTMQVMAWLDAWLKGAV